MINQAIHTFKQVAAWFFCFTASTNGSHWFHGNDVHPVDLAGLARSQGSQPESLPDATTARRVYGAAVCVNGCMSQPVESQVRWQFWNSKAWTRTVPGSKRHLVAMHLAGEADLLSLTTRYYRDRAKIAADRVRNQGTEGVAYTEPLNIRGLCPVGPSPDGLCEARNLSYHFPPGEI